MDIIIFHDVIRSVSSSSRVEEIEEPQTNEVSEKIEKEVKSYFGTEKEISEVKAFILEYGKTNIMEVVTQLIGTLATKSDRQWPSELATEYIKLYKLYRYVSSHVL